MIPAARRRRTKHQSLLQIFGLPTATLLVSFAGLVAGLVGSGLPDLLAWLLLSIPLLLIARCWMRRG